MRILIIGAGTTGFYLASKFCEEKHDVTLVDNREETLREAGSQLDVMTVVGSGSNPKILEQADIRNADLVAAVTGVDEVNILAALYARKLGVKYKVARVSSPDYLLKDNDFNLYTEGIDLLVCDKEDCASDLYDNLRLPGAIEVVDLLSGQVLAVGMKAHMDSPIVRSTVRDFPIPELLGKIRFLAVRRGAQTFVPRGDTQCQIGDDVYLVGKPDDVTDFIRWAWPEAHRFEKVIVAGAGDVGMSLARRLESTDIPVVMIERDEDRCNFASGTLQRALVLKGDMLDEEVLESCDIVDNTAFVAVTGEDEKNIIGCLLAQRYDVSFTMSMISRPQYVPVIQNLSLLDRAVSPYFSMVNAILHFVRGRNVRVAAVLTNLPGELLEVQITDKSRWHGKTVRDIRMPDGALIGTVLRGSDVFVAVGDTVLQSGDQLVVYALPQALPRLDHLFKK